MADSRRQSGQSGRAIGPAEGLGSGRVPASTCDMAEGRQLAGSRRGLPSPPKRSTRPARGPPLSLICPVSNGRVGHRNSKDAACRGPGGRSNLSAAGRLMPRKLVVHDPDPAPLPEWLCFVQELAISRWRHSRLGDAGVGEGPVDRHSQRRGGAASSLLANRRLQAAQLLRPAPPFRAEACNVCWRRASGIILRASSPAAFPKLGGGVSTCRLACITLAQARGLPSR
jgi:hypothetical protein